MMTMEEEDGYWELLPENLTLCVFSYLNVGDLCRAGAVCEKWRRISCDELLWKRLFHRHWKLKVGSVAIAPGRCSWRAEYERLAHRSPIHQSEVVQAHDNQVLHVSFARNGRLFATSSKDGFVKVWDSCYPTKLRHSADMKHFSWKYTQFSQFNETDTLLLVSGVHFGSRSNSGEIAVFDLQGEFKLQCRVINKPYDVFGTWYSENYLFSGELRRLAQLVSSSVLWLNKASQESDSEYKSVVTPLYHFYNKNASSIRTIMVANCLSVQEPSEEEGSSVATRGGGGNVDLAAVDADRPFRYSNDYRLAEREAEPDEDQDGPLLVCEECDMDQGARDSGDSTEDEDDVISGGKIDRPSGHAGLAQHCCRLPVESRVKLRKPQLHSPYTHKLESLLTKDDDDDTEGVVLDTRDKYLIFTTGSKTYTPHQIGFKRIRPFKFKDRIKLDLQQKLAERKERLANPRPLYQPVDDEEIQNRFDKADHLIDLHGHIIGMALSPDHRYLYVNNRPWPKGYHIQHAMHPPPIAQEIDIHVIDMVTLKEVGTMLRSHKAYTPNDECFFIFLDACNEYVASGAEDRHGYIWDRHYGICLAKLPHQDVVNSVAFNPTNSEMLISASDDNTLKIWRSKAQMKQLQVDSST